MPYFVAQTFTNYGPWDLAARHLTKTVEDQTAYS